MFEEAHLILLVEPTEVEKIVQLCVRDAARGCLVLSLGRLTSLDHDGGLDLIAGNNLSSDALDFHVNRAQLNADVANPLSALLLHLGVHTLEGAPVSLIAVTRRSILLVLKATQEVNQFVRSLFQHAVVLHQTSLDVRFGESGDHHVLVEGHMVRLHITCRPHTRTTFNRRGLFHRTQLGGEPHMVVILGLVVHVVADGAPYIHLTTCRNARGALWATTATLDIHVFGITADTRRTDYPVAGHMCQGGLWQTELPCLVVTPRVQLSVLSQCQAMPQTASDLHNNLVPQRVAHRNRLLAHFLI
mmetsp:Transcript_12351/g.33997  ORF Transcript_12351/g.33997 Transcript_12351/m.33997 type:complete len:302 (-) Transcript_12351:269-1174(-)